MRVRLKRDRLLELLARSGRSQNAWALRMGLSKGHWSDLVNGRHSHPSAKTRERILEAFGVPFEELFEIEDVTASGADVRSGLPERYVVDREIGEGAMGLVYLARDTRFSRRVALKVVSPEAVSDLGGDRFLKEIHRSGRLLHPNVLPVLDAGEAAGHPYYVTPYVEGGSLRSLLEDKGRLSLDEALPILRGIAAALDHAHGRGTLHGDVKPDNVLLADGHAYVADFGLSRAIHLEELRDWARPPEIDIGAGTPAYVSPEQARGEADLDGRSDVYSLACVAFEMLAGRPPFRGGSTTELIRRRFDSVPPDLRRQAPELRQEVCRVIAAAMAVDRDRRPATATELVERLELARTEAGSEAPSLALNTISSVARWAAARASTRPRGALMSSFLHDLQFSVRSLARRPLFALVTVITLALGIGANAAIFSVVHAVVLSPLPYEDPERLLVVRSTYEGRPC
ncbi:MAG: protein kinase domain-containing protein, partial [Acidobacteriota bacterium]